VPPPPTRHPAAGQGSLEYVGLLSVVAAVLAVAGPVAGVSGLGSEVVRVVRTGVCIVAGDVCRSSDAASAGLAPCTLWDRRRGGGAALTVMSMRLGGSHHWTVARRSDGSMLVTRADGDAAGVSGGLGFQAGPLRLGVDGTLGFEVAAGTAWELPDAATAARFLSEVRRGAAFDSRRWPPAWRSGDAGLAASGWAGLGVELGGEGALSSPLAGAEISAEGAAGARIGRGTSTLYLRSESQGPRLEDAFGHTVGATARGPVIAEYTRDRSGPRELAFRTAAPHARGVEVVETVARLDLRDPANRAVAARLLRHRAPWPPSVLEDLRAVIRHTVAVGTVERSVYAVSDHSGELELAGRFGLELGLKLERTNFDRRLVSATAWTGGTRARAREDCLG
jgi:hypothetical protein